MWPKIPAKKVQQERENMERKDTNLIHATMAYAHFSLKPPYLENTFNSAIKHPQQTHAAIWITCHAAQLQRITNPSQSFEEI